MQISKFLFNIYKKKIGLFKNQDDFIFWQEAGRRTKYGITFLTEKFYYLKGEY